MRVALITRMYRLRTAPTSRRKSVPGQTKASSSAASITPPTIGKITCQGRLFERVRLGEPPQVVAGRVPQARQRQLHGLPRRRVRRHPGDQRFESVEIRMPPEPIGRPVIEGLLSEGAFRVIDRREHVVHQEVVPRPIVNRFDAVRGSGARPVVVVDVADAAGAGVGVPPQGPHLVAPARPREPRQSHGRNNQGRQRDRRYGESHRALTASRRIRAAGTRRCGSSNSSRPSSNSRPNTRSCSRRSESTAVCV